MEAGGGRAQRHWETVICLIWYVWNVCLLVGSVGAVQHKKRTQFGAILGSISRWQKMYSICSNTRTMSADENTIEHPLTHTRTLAFR